MSTYGYSGPSIDHGLLSPSGHCSKRARKAAQALDDARIQRWFDAKYAAPTPEAAAKRAEKARSLRRHAADLRGLAARGMQTRKLTKEAERVDAEAAALEQASE